MGNIISWEARRKEKEREEAKVPLNHWVYVACARYKEHPDCVHYLLEKGCPEPTDEEYARFVERQQQHEEEQRLSRKTER